MSLSGRTGCVLKRANSVIFFELRFRSSTDFHLMKRNDAEIGREIIFLQ